MGKSPKPITFVLTEADMLQWPRFQELQGQGHTLVLLDDLLAGVGVVMGARAHYLAPGMEGLVDVALKSARALQYPKHVKE